jgi:hypothetical protein
MDKKKNKKITAALNVSLFVGDESSKKFVIISKKL